MTSGSGKERDARLRKELPSKHETNDNDNDIDITTKKIILRHFALIDSSIKQ